MSARAAQVKRATPQRSPRPKAKPPLRVVSRKKKRRVSRVTRRAPVAILGGILVVAVVFGILLEQVVLAQSAFKVAKLQKKLTHAQERQESLLRDSASLESPARIERVARKRLGMVDPTAREINYIVADIQPPDASYTLAGSRAGGIAAAAESAVEGAALGSGAP